MGAHEDRNSKTNVQGGASAVPTPANKVNNTPMSGGKNQDPNPDSNNSSSSSSTTTNIDKINNNNDDDDDDAGSSSFQGPGHTTIPNPAASIGGFLGLSDQKGAAAARNRQRVAESGGFVDKDMKNSRVGETCDTEDHSFMQRKPGGPDTLPGHSVIQGVLDRFTK